ncbi:hypothetical protein LTR66_013682 [Elasticomyces elasticus]|nr:hypothetical protein LTR66_013682 [Elasticomyces elasticus]
MSMKATSDVYPTSQASISDSEEQTQGLLDSQHSDEIDAEKHSGALNSSASTCRSRKSVLVIVTSAVLAFLTIYIVLHGGWSTARRSSDDASRPVKNNDYVLDRAWDYDAAPMRREYSWKIADTIHNPDGVYCPMMLINHEFPGPFVEANEGDTIVVQVANVAVNATSIHWHGLYQNSTPWMDGTVGTTQCPIAPGSSFTYEFKVDGQAGTYWYHAHQGVQASDGLISPLVIHAKNEKKTCRC